MMTDPTPPHELTYGKYLKIDELLDLQQCLSRDPETGEPEHDETLFIIIHQVYELWFKQVLHELDAFARSLDDDAPSEGGRRLNRVLKILKTLVAQLDVLETMTPLEFSSFRSFLANSSGFQSAQFREVEFLLGQKTRDHLDRFEPNPTEFARLTRRYSEPTLWDSFVRFLDRRGYEIPSDLLERDVTQPVVESSGIQAALIEVYRTDPALTQLCEALTDLDEGIQEWRYRHVMMVQRTIGAKIGTGGSPGAAYLRETLFRPVFPDLWAVRSQF
jgi:tryptophan 2,3-dioxygenase